MRIGVKINSAENGNNRYNGMGGNENHKPTPIPADPYNAEFNPAFSAAISQNRIEYSFIKS